MKTTTENSFETCPFKDLTVVVKDEYGDSMNGGVNIDYKCGAHCYEDWMRYPGCKDHTIDYFCSPKCPHYKQEIKEIRKQPSEEMCDAMSGERIDPYEQDDDQEEENDV